MAHDPHEQFGRYELQFLIGRGGMAETWRARLLGAAGVTKPVLIKKVLPEFADDDAFVSMFISEARISASLSHGNVAQVFDFGMMDGQYFLAMELVDGQPLHRVLKRGARMGLPRLPIPLAVYVALEMCRGLNYAHTRTNERGVPLGIVHRDISPDNVLISYEGQVKIVDFGIAKARMLRGFHTEPGVVRGKYLYFSPEQARGRDVDARTDIWATGLVLYEMLCGQPPVVGPEPVVLTRMAQGDFPPPIQLRQELPPELNELILKALSVDVARRFESANAFGDTLAAFLYSFAPRFSTMNLAYLVRELFREDLQKDGRELQVPPAFVEELSTWREQESPGSGPRAPLPDVTPEDARPTTPGVGAGVRPAPSGPPLASTRPTTPGPAKAVRGDGGAGERSTGGGASPATPPRASTSGSATRSTPPRSAVTSGPRAMPGGAVSSVEASNGGAPSPTTPGPSSPRRTQTSGELPASSASTSEARSFSASPARRTRTEGSLPAAPELTVPAFAFSASAPSGPSVSPPPRRTRTEGSLAAVVPEAPDSTVPEFSLSASNPSGPSSSPPRRARTEGSLPSVVPEASEFTRPEFSLSALIASGPSSTTPPRRTQTSTLFSVASDDAAENTMPAFSVSASSSSGGSVSSPRRTQTAGSLPAAVHDASSAVSTPTVRFPSVQGPSSSSPHRTQTSGSMPSDLQEVSSARAANSHPEGYPGSAQTTSGAAPPLPRRTQTSGSMPMVLQEVPSARAATSYPEGYPGSAPSTSAAASPPPRRTQTSGPVPLVAQDASTRAASSPAEGHSAPAPGTVATSTSSPRRTRTLGSIPAVVPESSARAASASVESPHPGATSATPGAPRRTHTLDSAPRAIPEASTRAASAPTEVLRSDAVPTPPFPASPPPRRTLPAGMAPMSNQEASARAANAPTVVLNSVPAGSAPTVRLASISIPRRHRRTVIAAGAALLLLSAVAIPFLVSRRSEPGEISPTQPIPAPTEPGGANPLRPQARPQPAPGDPTAASPDPRPLVAVSPHGSPGADGTEPTDEPESVGEYPKETAFVLDSKRHVLRVPLDLVAFSRLDASASYSFWGMTQAKWMADPLIQEPTPRREPLVFFLLSGDAVRPEVREGIVSRHPITLQGVRAISLFTLGEPTREDLSPQSVYLRKVNTEDQQRFTFHPEPMRLSARKGFLIKGLDVRQTYALSLVPRGEGVFLRGRAHGPAAQVACLEWSPHESAPGPREPGAHAEQPLQVLISEWREARVRGIQGMRCAFIDDASFDNEGEAEVHVTPWEKARRPSTPNHEEAERLALQAQRLARSGQHHDAFLLAEDCLRMAPEQPDCLVLSGAMQLLLGRTEGALERYRTFVKRHPHHPEARSVNGILQTYGQTNSGKTPPPLGR
ncbi:protein kinase [Myxococcus sp. XM-1-1-1]|uniref:serine/threonine protein kinase n=1 Tax=Myxococcus sp. XM-1-1-1 TaxID=2874602 RepID=UPI001CBDE8E8|nr:serine/threonine protein kinase [Myxococcus sp. XM-1-1-1]MBZ4411145.1 protein kinase [Myxococcus sp. XM-1-1-1]